MDKVMANVKIDDHVWGIAFNRFAIRFVAILTILGEK